MKLDALRKRLRQTKPKPKASEKPAKARAKHKGGIVPVTGAREVACSLCGGMFDPSQGGDRFFKGFSMCPKCDHEIVGPHVVGDDEA